MLLQALGARMLPDEMKIDTVARHISGGIRIPWQAKREPEASQRTGYLTRRRSLLR
jgi:hypothetical protein